MHCIHCGKNIPSDSKFCQFCGNGLSDIPRENYSVGEEYCQVCGRNAPTKHIHFEANIGMLFARRKKEIEGNLCKDCINKFFWNFTLTNLFLGWWGVISFFATIIFILKNTSGYISALSLKRYY